MKLKLARFASWPSLCADVDVVNNNEKRRHRNKLLKYRSILTLNHPNKSVNYMASNEVNPVVPNLFEFENSDEFLKNSKNNSIVDIVQIKPDVDNCLKLPENLINFASDEEIPSENIDFNSNSDENFLFSVHRDVERRRNSKEIVDNLQSFVVKSEILRNTCESSSLIDEFVVENSSLLRSEALKILSLTSSKNSNDKKINKSESLPNHNELESPCFKIVEEKDDGDGHFSRDDSSNCFDIDERSNVKFRRPMPPGSPSMPRSSLHHRLSVPNMTAYRSSSTQDVSRDDEDVERGDDYFDESNDSSKIAALKKHRNVSVSSLILSRTDSQKDKATDRRRVSHGDGHASSSVDDDDGDLFIEDDHLLKTLKSFDRSFSASTPSINDAGQTSSPTAAKLLQSKNEGNDVALRPNKVKHARTPSLYVPSITPRLPLMALLPGSVRRPHEKPSDPKEKTKDKEKRSFFRPRMKSKEKKPHVWIKVACSNSDVCESCTKPLANTDAYQCNECLISIHCQCKEQVEKIACAKIKHPKTAKASSNHSSMSMSLPEKPKNIVNRYSSLKSEAILTHRLSDPRLDVSHNLMVVEETPNEYPSGFYPATKPSAHWNDLNLWQEEPEAWSNSYGKTEKKKITSKEAKRQDIIHEMYVTEKHHCQILVVLKHCYFDTLAMHKIVSIDDLNKLLPRLDDLLNIHGNFLRLLKQRKEETTVVGPLHDVLLAQFSGDLSMSMIDAYTKFCSQKDATDRTFQELNQTNVPFQTFIKSISLLPFYKSRSLRDCLLLITQRLSKYHSFVENLRKNTCDDLTEKEGMIIAEKAVKDLVGAVDAGIDKIQLEQFRMRLAQEMDSKSVTPYDKKLFSPKDLISDDRRLVYYTNVHWPNAKRHPADVILLLFTDVIVFVQRGSNGQYNFFTQDGKAGVISVRKMIVRDKAGKLGSDGVYLIATYPKPEMYEVRCKTKKENVSLMNKIQKTVENCPSTVCPAAEIVEPPSSTLISSKEQQELLVLFDKLPDTNKKLQNYFDDVIKVYEDISDYVARLAPRIKNNEDKEKLASIVNSCMDSYLNSIHPNAIAATLFGNAAKDKVQQQINVLQYDGDAETSYSSTSSSENSVLRSNTFHGRIGNSIRRRALRKHPTISGVLELDVITASGFTVVDGSSCESISEEPTGRLSSRRSTKDVTFSILKHLSETKVEMTRLRESNARLECELALAREQLQHRSRQTAAVDNNYHTLEELRNLHASLDKKKKDYMQFVEDKQVDLNRREKNLDERDAELTRKDGELQERWEKLFQAWDLQRMNGLPVVSPLTAAIPNGELRRSYSVLSPTSTVGHHHQPTLGVHRQSPDGPKHLMGLVNDHGRIDETKKNVLPTKLKDPSVTESLSARLGLVRNSTKKKWHSTSKLTKPNEATSPPTQQMIPNKLATVSSSKKK